MFDHDAARFFARQHGLITRDQAGPDYGPVRHRLTSGRWVRVGGGVYRLAGLPVTWHQRALAACLIAGPKSVVSHRSAAVVYGVSGFRPGRIEITVPPGTNNRNPLATVHRATVDSRTRRDGLPVTPPARTLADLARTVGLTALAEAVDDVLTRRLTSLDRLGEDVPPKLRRVLDAWTGELPDSIAEMRLVRVLLQAGLPQPRRQYWIAAAHARVDLAYPAERIAIELDSFRWHGGRQPFDADRARGNRIVAAGWHLLRTTPTNQPTNHDELVSAVVRLRRHVA